MRQIDFKGLSGIDIRKVNKKNLVDVSQLNLDTSIPREQRREFIFHKVKNPYCFRVGDLGVKLEFIEDATSLEDCLTDFLKRKKSGL